jgi:hypothetical protein
MMSSMERISVEVSGQASVACVACGSVSGIFWAGWRAYHVDDPKSTAAPTLSLYCPTCAETEFGYSRRV